MLTVYMTPKTYSIDVLYNRFPKKIRNKNFRIHTQKFHTQKNYSTIFPKFPLPIIYIYIYIYITHKNSKQRLHT